MLIQKEAKPWLCAAKSGHAVITHAHLRITDGKGRLEATNGKCLVAIDVELSEGDAPGLIPVDALKEAKPIAGIREIRANGLIQAETKAGTVTMSRPEGAYPDVDAVRGEPGEVTLSLNAAFLKAIQDAYGAEAVTLRITVPSDGSAVSDPVHVAPYRGVVTGWGLIMPMV